MIRWALFLAAPISLAFSGCQGIAELPGIDPTDYAYSNFMCNTSQVYSQPVPQLRGSVLEAMGDLGYTDIRCEPKGDAINIQARTVDGRKARITLRPRNTMSSMTVKVGDLGDETVAQALIQRVSTNFGELPRTVIPMEPVLARRVDPLSTRRLFVPPDGFITTQPGDSTPAVVPDAASPFAR
jgi:hypothetical protein